MQVALALDSLAGRTGNGIVDGTAGDVHVAQALDAVVVGVERQGAAADECCALAVNTDGLVLGGRDLEVGTVQDEGIVGLSTTHAAGVNIAVSPVGARAVDIDSAGGAGHRAVALHAACAVARHGDIDHGSITVDGEVAVGAHAGGFLDLALVTVPNGDARVLQSQGTALNVDVALGLDTLGAGCAAVDGQRAALDEYMAILLGIGSVLGIHLDTVVTAALDVDGTAVHLEVLGHVDGVGNRT